MKTNLGVFFGGKSLEHESSIISAIEIMKIINNNKYNVIPIYVTKEGEFYTGSDLMNIDNYAELADLLDKCTNVTFSVNDKEYTILNNENGMFFKKIVDKIDVAFPIFHGSNGGDGNMAGLFELMNIPYIGSNVLTSSIAMDKVSTRMIVQESGIQIVDYLWFFSNMYFSGKEKVISGIQNSLSFPVNVKPSNVALNIKNVTAYDASELEEAIDSVTTYTNKIIVEGQVENLKKISCSVIGDASENYVSSCMEEIKDFNIYDITKKYKDTNRVDFYEYYKIPKGLSDDMITKIKRLAKIALVALNASGVVKVDFAIDSRRNEIYLSDFEAMPFMLSRNLWEESGLNLSDLIDKLVEFAIKKNKDKNKLMFVEQNGILIDDTKIIRKEKKIAKEDKSNYANTENKTSNKEKFDNFKNEYIKPIKFKGLKKDKTEEVVKRRAKGFLGF